MVNRHLFEKRRGSGSYDRLADLLAKDCNTFASIGAEFGLSRERVRQIHNEILPLRLKHGRQIACTIARMKPVKPFPQGVLAVWRRARQLGFSVERIRKASTSPQCYVKKLRINGRACMIYCPDKLVKPKKSSRAVYAYFQPRIEADFHILVANGMVFIFPRQFIKRRRYGRSCYVPIMDYPVYKNRYPRTDWRRFKDAWKLLEKEARECPSPR